MASKSQTVTEKNEPWAAAIPYIETALLNYQVLYNSDIYGVNITEPRDAFTLEAEATAYSRATNATSNAAGVNSQIAIAALVADDVVADVAGLEEIRTQTDYVRSADVYTNVEALVVPTVTAQFAAGNRIGGALYQSQMTKTLGETFSPFAMQADQAELSSKLQAAQAITSAKLQAAQITRSGIIQGASIADSVDRARMADVGILAGIGADREAYAKRILDAPYIQNARALDTYGTAGGFGGTSQRTNDMGSKGAQGALGGAIAGGAQGAMIGGPFGAVAGAALGALGGL